MRDPPLAGHSGHQERSMSVETTIRRKRLLLLLSPNTYRAGAFLNAAERLGVEVVKGIDVPRGLEDWWDLPLAVDFADAEGATRAIAAFHAAHPLDAILSVDDTATILATHPAPALGLPHNPLESAEAARDKGL